MDCNDYQEAIRTLHFPAGANLDGAETNMDLASKHITDCEQCQAWFSQNMCPKIQNEIGDDAQALNVFMIHDMLHTRLESKCQYL